MNTIIVEHTDEGDFPIDIFTRLAHDRILFINDNIDDGSLNVRTDFFMEAMIEVVGKSKLMIEGLNAADKILHGISDIEIKNKKQGTQVIP